MQQLGAKKKVLWAKQTARRCFATEAGSCSQGVSHVVDINGPFEGRKHPDPWKYHLYANCTGSFHYTYIFLSSSWPPFLKTVVRVYSERFLFLMFLFWGSPQVIALVRRKSFKKCLVTDNQLRIGTHKVEAIVDLLALIRLWTWYLNTSLSL